MALKFTSCKLSEKKKIWISSIWSDKIFVASKIKDKTFMEHNILLKYKDLFFSSDNTGK